jgi:hypothetical protein
MSPVSTTKLVVALKFVPGGDDVEPALIGDEHARWAKSLCSVLRKHVLRPLGPVTQMDESSAGDALNQRGRCSLMMNRRTSVS